MWGSFEAVQIKHGLVCAQLALAAMYIKQFGCLCKLFVFSADGFVQCLQVLCPQALTPSIERCGSVVL